jgi:hypothetical protein
MPLTFGPAVHIVSADVLGTLIRVGMLMAFVLMAGIVVVVRTVLAGRTVLMNLRTSALLLRVFVLREVSRFITLPKR